jgi:hypothetical protein
VEDAVGKRLITTACAVIATMLVALGCSETSAPTRPTSVSSAAAVSVTAQGNPVTMSWSCVAESATGTMGIFAGAIRSAACPAQLGILPFAVANDAPSAPPNLASSVNGSTVTLVWQAPASPEAATSYLIEAGSSAGSSNLLVFDTLSPATAFTATNVPPGTYFVRVRARNSDGASVPSNEVVVVVGGAPCAGPPGAPSGLTASVNGSTVSLAWTAASGCAPTAYVVEAGSSPGSSNLANFTIGSTATTFSAAGVPVGTYYVRVRAASGSGAGGPSNEVIVTVGGGSPSSVTGRWVGVAPEGIIILQDPYDVCPAEYDLQLDLTSNGTEVTGTGTTRLRRVEAAGPCGSVLGEVATYGVIDGNVGSGSISLTLGGNRTFRFSGTFTATRMTGTVAVREFTPFAQSASFAVNRQ